MHCVPAKVPCWFSEVGFWSTFTFRKYMIPTIQYCIVCKYCMFWCIAVSIMEYHQLVIQYIIMCCFSCRVLQYSFFTF